jgi:hypothetical protein
LVVCVFAIFTALGLACAVWVSRLRREPGIGRRRDALAGLRPRQGEPRYCRDLQRIYSREQLETIARRPVQSDLESGGASRPDADVRRRAIPRMSPVPAGTRAAGGRHG